jgi:uncharacterized protein YkwD
MGFAGALAAVLACIAPRVAAHPATAAPAPSAACPDAHVRPSAANARALDTATLCLIDKLRAARGLRELHANPQLAGIANGKVLDMLREDYFADGDPAGQEPTSRYATGAAHVSVGESLAWGEGREATPAYIVSRWMASPAHREVLLYGDYREAGVAIAPRLPRVLRGRSRGRGATYAIELGARSF